MTNIEQKEIWVWEYEGKDDWDHGRYDTREEAIKAGLEQAMQDCEECIFVGKLNFVPLPSIDADELLQQIEDEYYDQVGEAARSWYACIESKDIDKLSERLNKVFNEWLEETGNTADGYTVTDVEEVL